MPFDFLFILADFDSSLDPLKRVESVHDLLRDRVFYVFGVNNQLDWAKKEIMETCRLVYTPPFTSILTSEKTEEKEHREKNDYVRQSKDFAFLDFEYQDVRDRIQSIK